MAFCRRLALGEIASPSDGSCKATRPFPAMNPGIASLLRKKRLPHRCAPSDLPVRTGTRTRAAHLLTNRLLTNLTLQQLTNAQSDTLGWRVPLEPSFWHGRECHESRLLTHSFHETGIQLVHPRVDNQGQPR